MQQPEDDRVEPVTQEEEITYEEMGTNGKPPVTGGIAGGWRALALLALISIIVCFGMLTFYAMPQMVTKDDFTTNIQGVVTDIGALQTTDGEFTASLRNTTDIVASLQSSIQSLESTLSNLSNTYVSKSYLTSMLLDYLEIGDMSSYITFSYLSENYVRQTQLDSLVTIVKLTEEIAKLEERIKALEEGSSVSGISISSFYPTSGGSGTVVTIVGDGFTEVTNVTFGDVSAASVVVNSPTEIKAMVGSGATGFVTVFTSSSSATSTSIFTYGSGGGTVLSGVSVIYSPTSVFTLPNSVNVSITNTSGQDIFGGQFSITIQYLDAIPSSTNMVGLSSTEIVWRTSGSVSGVKLTIVGTASSVFIMDGQTRIITIDITPPLSGIQFRITDVTYTGWLY